MTCYELIFLVKAMKIILDLINMMFAMLLQVKDYPGFNFISLIYGPGSDTQKRLEKVRNILYLRSYLHPFIIKSSPPVLVLILLVENAIIRKLEQKYVFLVPNLTRERR